MKTKSIVRDIILIYVICQMLYNLYFFCVSKTMQAGFIFWLLTILGSLFFGAKLYSCQLSQILQMRVDKFLFLKILICLQIISIPFLVYFSFVSIDEIHPVFVGIFEVLHLPECILLDVVHEIIYYVVDLLTQNAEYVLHYAFSIYPFTAILLFMEIYLLSKKQKNIAINKVEKASLFA